MKTRLIKIGNSQGIRIPKAIIDQVGLGDALEMRVHRGTLVIECRKRPRAGWAEAFALMHRQGDDHLLDEERRSRWDEEEWEW